MPSFNIPGVGPVGVDQIVGAVFGLVSVIGLVLGLTLGLGDSGSSSAVPSTTTSKPSVTTPATTKPSEPSAPPTTEPKPDPTTKPGETEPPVPPTTEPKPEPGEPTVWTSEPLDGRKINIYPDCRFGYSAIRVVGDNRYGEASFLDEGTVVNTVFSTGKGDQKAPSTNTFDVWGTFDFYYGSMDKHELVKFKVTGIKNACVFGEEVSKFVIQ